MDDRQGNFPYLSPERKHAFSPGHEIVPSPGIASSLQRAKHPLQRSAPLGLCPLCVDARGSGLQIQSHSRHFALHSCPRPIISERAFISGRDEMKTICRTSSLEPNGDGGHKSLLRGFMRPLLGNYETLEGNSQGFPRIKESLMDGMPEARESPRRCRHFSSCFFRNATCMSRTLA